MPTIDTRLIHDGEPDPPIEGAVAMPVFQSATYASSEDAPVRYARYNNTPNHEALHAKCASLMETEAALVTGSGMAAISSALLGVLESGDHVLAQPGLYGGTMQLLNDLLPRFGITHSTLPAGGPEAWADALRPETRVLYAETIANPTMDVPDLEAMVRFADAHDLLAVVDNTFASPVNLRPATLGFDVVLHSATKYLAGHSDLVAGVVGGSAAHVQRIGKALKQLGGTLDPHACFLLHRSLKTLGVRVRQQNANAQALAEMLAAHDAVDTVRYPGLPSHPAHDRVMRRFDGCGGMISFDLQPSVAPDAFLDALTIPLVAPSLGGVETLVTRPIRTSHADVDAATREALGLTERFIRLSVGIEGINDLVDDVTQALDACRQPAPAS